MILIDTHSHIYSKEFNEDIHKVIQRAKEAGVEKIFLPNIDSESIKPMMRLAREFHNTCYPMIGLHPTSVKENYLEELEIVEKWLQQERFYAIGEVGIDLYWDKTYITQQQEAFDRQIKMSQKMELPLIIHSRDSFEEIFEVLDSYKGSTLRGIFHSFTGDLCQAQKAIEMGFLIGAGGILTFRNAGLVEVFKHIRLKHIVLETDAPYLAPVPKRGKRNESSYLTYIAEKLATIHNTTLEEVATQTTNNASELFGIPK